MAFLSQHQAMALPIGKGGVTTQVDERGRTQSLSQPGLATKSFAYDDSDELTQVSIGDRVVESYTYEQGRLSHYSAGEGAEAETVAIQYDEQDRIKTLTSSQDGPLAEYSYGDSADKTGKTAVKFANKIRTYRDPNGVLATYSYADNGSIKSIDIENGPSFRYSYDADNDLESVSIDDMKAEFGSYTHYRPSTVKWLYNGAPIETLTSQFDQQGRLSSLGNGAYQLELTWSTVAKAPDVGEDQGEIIRVVRKAPGFAEIWIPSYDAETRLQSVEIQRFADGDPTGTPSQIIQEGYGPIVHRIIGSLTRNVDGQALLNLSQDLDQTANNLRWSTQTDAASSNVLSATYDDTGNLAQISDSNNGVEEFHWDGFRRLTGVTGADGQSFTYTYDAQDRRILSTDSNSLDPLVYFYQDSRVIAIGQKKPWGIAWTHAIGYGPTGPVLIKDMTTNHQGRDYFVFTDQLGTPFAYRDADSGEVFFTPYSPWGELLANPTGVPQTAGTVETAGFDLPPDPLFATTPLSLGGHLLDHNTGLTYMHHRYYSPRHGQFLTPDFRAPDIYDPTTTSEPYAYAAGNPVMYWDPDGLHDEAGVIRAFTEKYGENEKAMMALLVVLSRYRIVQGDQWLNDWSVDHKKRQIAIASSIGLGWERSNENAADQLYQAFSDEFYDITELPETFGGTSRRIGGAGLKIVGGSASIIGGSLLLMAPEPTLLTKIGGAGAIGFGTNTIVEGSTQIWRRQGGINFIGEGADAYERAVSGGLADEWYLRSRTWVNFSGAAFEIGSAGGYSRFLRTTPLRQIPAATKEALSNSLQAFKTRFSTAPKAGSLSNEATRIWYHQQLDGVISKIDPTLPLRERALQAFHMRNEIKLQARNLMADKATASTLPAPKTLQDVIKNAYKLGHRGDDVWLYILGSSQRSNVAVDTALGIVR